MVIKAQSFGLHDYPVQANQHQPMLWKKNYT